MGVIFIAPNGSPAFRRPPVSGVDGGKPELSAGRDSDPAVTPSGDPLIRKERSDLRINVPRVCVGRFINDK